MSFLAPLALLGAAILGPVIVAMYMLKLRREDRQVSSTFLWQRMVRDVEANAPWQRLRPNLLLLLQLLLLLLLVLALARPFFRTPGISGRNLILILDRSASMGATDGSPDRLSAARDLAVRLVDQLPDQGRATIIAAGGQMEVPASSTTDRRELHRAIQEIALRNGGGSDLSPALTLASALAAREDESEVAILSDGNVTLPPDLEVPARVRYFPVGRSGENVAISALALQPGPGGQTLFAQAINYGEQPATRRLDLYLDGELFNAYNLTLNPQQEQSIVTDIPASVQIVEARLNEGDGLVTDDRAWAVSTLGDETTVRVVGPGNRFLETALELLPGVKVLLAEPQATAFEQTAAQVPVTILDGVIPPVLPPGNLLFIAPPRSTDFFSVTGEIEFPSVHPAPGDEPLLRNVSLSEVSVLKAVRVVPGVWARVVIDSEPGPLLVAGESQGRRLAVLSFDLHQSDLPLQVAFPLLLSNLVSFLSPGSGAEASQLAPGQPLALQVDPAITEVRLTRPDGTQLSTQGGLLQSASLHIQDGQMVYADTDEMGVYTVEEFREGALQARHRYAVNLFAPGESQIAPQPDLAVPQTSGLQTTVARQREGRQEVWRWLAALALVVLLAEWLVYHKSGLAYLRERWRKARARL
ncbi:MAG: VWA domain-containing protein [Chloroflexaceae bacterium]|nr:VWA domain-containing protein [Chloroflexaceae bacterium]